MVTATSSTKLEKLNKKEDSFTNRSSAFLYVTRKERDGNILDIVSSEIKDDLWQQFSDFFLSDGSNSIDFETVENIIYDVSLDKIRNILDRHLVYMRRHEYAKTHKLYYKGIQDGTKLGYDSCKSEMSRELDNAYEEGKREGEDQGYNEGVLDTEDKIYQNAYGNGNIESFPATLGKLVSELMIRIKENPDKFSVSELEYLGDSIRSGVSYAMHPPRDRYEKKDYYPLFMALDADILQKR